VDDLKIKSSKENSIISGDFTSNFEDGQKCISGKLYLVSDHFLEHIEERLSQEDTTSTIDPKSAHEALRQIRSDKVILEKDQEMEILSDGMIEITVWDKHDADGDRISILLDGRVIERDLLLSNEKKSYTINCHSKKCTLKVLALNEGKSPPNTVELELKNQQHITPIIGKLNKGEAIFLQIRTEH
jgi:hypothetical protein